MSVLLCCMQPVPLPPEHHPAQLPRLCQTLASTEAVPIEVVEEGDAEVADDSAA